MKLKNINSYILEQSYLGKYPVKGTILHVSGTVNGFPSFFLFLHSFVHNRQMKANIRLIVKYESWPWILWCFKPSGQIPERLLSVHGWRQALFAFCFSGGSSSDFVVCCSEGVPDFGEGQGDADGNRTADKKRMQGGLGWISKMFWAFLWLSDFLWENWQSIVHIWNTEHGSLTPGQTI